MTAMTLPDSATTATDAARLPPLNEFAAPATSSPPAQALFQELIDSGLVLAEDWNLLGRSDRESISDCYTEDDLLQRLVETNLLNVYQAVRLRGGKSFGL